jgi:hypothetical protein
MHLAVDLAGVLVLVEPAASSPPRRRTEDEYLAELLELLLGRRFTRD